MPELRRAFLEDYYTVTDWSVREVSSVSSFRQIFSGISCNCGAYCSPKLRSRCAPCVRDSLDQELLRFPLISPPSVGDDVTSSESFLARSNSRCIEDLQVKDVLILLKVLLQLSSLDRHCYSTTSSVRVCPRGAVRRAVNWSRTNFFLNGFSYLPSTVN